MLFNLYSCIEHDIKMLYNIKVSSKVKLNQNVSDDLKKEIVHQLTTNKPKHDDLRDAVLLTLDNQTMDWVGI